MDGESSFLEDMPCGDIESSQERNLHTFCVDIASLLRDEHFQQMVSAFVAKRGRALDSRFVAEEASQRVVSTVLDKLPHFANDFDFIKSVVSELVQNVVAHGSKELFDCPGARIDCAYDEDFVAITTTQLPLEKDKFDVLQARLDGLQVHTAVADRIVTSQAGVPFQAGGMGLVVLKGLLDERGGALSIHQDDCGLQFCARFPRMQS